MRNSINNIVSGEEEEEIIKRSNGRASECLQGRATNIYTSSRTKHAVERHHPLTDNNNLIMNYYHILILGNRIKCPASVASTTESLEEGEIDWSEFNLIGKHLLRITVTMFDF